MKWDKYLRTTQISFNSLEFNIYLLITYLPNTTYKLFISSLYDFRYCPVKQMRDLGLKELINSLSFHKWIIEFESRLLILEPRLHPQIWVIVITD
jgi:hypothetical protein